MRATRQVASCPPPARARRTLSCSAPHCVAFASTCDLRAAADRLLSFCASLGALTALDARRAMLRVMCCRCAAGEDRAAPHRSAPSVMQFDCDPPITLLPSAHNL